NFVEIKKKAKVTHIDLFFSFFLLGLSSFGGPIAHIGYFRNVFVKQKNWLDEKTYIDFVSLCNFLPGPSSSQVGMSIGYHFKGISGSLLAWLGFTFPSAIILMFFGYAILNFDNSISNGILQGLKAIVVVIVIQAILGMGKNLLKDYFGYIIVSITTVILIFFPSSFNQFMCLVFSGFFGLILYKNEKQTEIQKTALSNIKLLSCAALLLFFSLLFLLPFLSEYFGSNILKLASSFFRIGSLVFGGGHVVLPLLQEEFVSSGLIEKDIFLAGYGAAQAIPGPLFTFSSYLGIFLKAEINVFITSLLCLFFIFLPSFLLVVGILPIWQEFKKMDIFVRAFKGINASVIGLLVAALYNPIILSSLSGLEDIILILIAFVVLFFTKIPQWLAVFILSTSGWVLSLLLT
ncbi:chromate efflux transporter, partial [Alphaproteobacteria bacterium]|nr:chromate efflux transporter [Alphaproteobacteria bacterium]